MTKILSYVKFLLLFVKFMCMQNSDNYTGEYDLSENPLRHTSLCSAAAQNGGGIESKPKEDMHMKHLLRRFLALTLALTILASLAVFPAAAEERFQDVSSGSWYSEAVEYVSTRGYMTGVGADSFAPNKT